MFQISWSSFAYFYLISSELELITITGTGQFLTHHSLTQWQKQANYFLHPTSFLLFLSAFFSVSDILLFIFCFLLLSDSGLLEFSEPGRTAMSGSESEVDTNKSRFWFSFLPNSGALHLLYICKGQRCQSSAYQSCPPAGTDKGCTRLDGTGCVSMDFQNMRSHCVK